jgi:uncharacterized protein (DUF1697 family)
MTTFVALLRAVNVGGTGKLPMGDLRSLCAKAGFTNVQTYIASGNVIFSCRKSETQVKVLLEAGLEDYAGKTVGVFVRTAAEMAEISSNNPFPEAPANRTVAIFLDAPPPRDALDRVVGRNGERIELGAREIYVHYGDRMAKSKLKIPAAKAGTARNMNTVASSPSWQPSSRVSCRSSFGRGHFWTGDSPLTGLKWRIRRACYCRPGAAISQSVTPRVDCWFRCRRPCSSLKPLGIRQSEARDAGRGRRHHVARR